MPLVHGEEKLRHVIVQVTVPQLCSEQSPSNRLILFWLPPRDSNPDMLIQSQLSYHSRLFLRFPGDVSAFLSFQ